MTKLSALEPACGRGAPGGLGGLGGHRRARAVPPDPAGRRGGLLRREERPSSETSTRSPSPGRFTSAVLFERTSPACRFKVHYDRNEVDLVHVAAARTPFFFQTITPGCAGDGGYSVAQLLLR